MQLGKKSSSDSKKHPPGSFMGRLKERKIIATLAAFIGGGWLTYEVVHWILVDHYHLPNILKDITIVTFLGALLSTVIWRWFRGAEKRPGNVEIEVLVVPLIILLTIVIDLKFIFTMTGISINMLLIGIVSLFLGIAWVVFKSLQWAASVPEAEKKTEVLKPVEEKPISFPEWKKSIVVLPFENISPEEGQDYFCDGMTEEIITDLSSIHDLRVISRSSAMMLKGSKKAVGDIAKELDVQYVLEGSVRKAGNDIRISAQLIDAAEDSHLWAKKYSGTLDDVFDIQEKVSRSIVDALKLKLSEKEERRIAEHTIDNALAYEYYLKARDEQWKMTKEGLDTALQYLRRGLDIIGENVLLLAGMGYVYYEYVNTGIWTDDKYIGKAQQYAQRIFEIEPDSPYGHLILGLVNIWWKSPQEGVRHLKRVLSYNPNDLDALIWLCAVCANIGKKDATFPLADKLMEIDPLNEWAHWVPGFIQFWDGQFDTALDIFKRISDSFPESFFGPWFYALSLIYTQNFSKARSIFDDLEKKMPGFPFSELALKFEAALEGDRDEALHWKSRELEIWAWRDFQLSYYVSVAFSMVDAKEVALDWLEHAVDIGMINYPFITEHDPLLENIRGEERFKKLMERVKHEWENFEV